MFLFVCMSLQCNEQLLSVYFLKYHQKDCCDKNHLEKLNKIHYQEVTRIFEFQKEEAKKFFKSISILKAVSFGKVFETEFCREKQEFILNL